MRTPHLIFQRRSPKENLGIPGWYRVKLETLHGFSCTNSFFSSRISWRRGDIGEEAGRPCFSLKAFQRNHKSETSRFIVTMNAQVISDSFAVYNYKVINIIIHLIYVFHKCSGQWACNGYAQHTFKTVNIDRVKLTLDKNLPIWTPSRLFDKIIWNIPHPPNSFGSLIEVHRRWLLGYHRSNRFNLVVLIEIEKLRHDIKATHTRFHTSCTISRHLPSRQIMFTFT